MCRGKKNAASRVLALLAVVILILALSSCGQKSDDKIIARINGRDITWSDIKDDVAFVAGSAGVEKGDVEYNSIVADVLNSFLIDTMCEMECEERGVQYDREYYGQCLLSLYGAHGSEEALVKKLKSFGLDHSYAESVCKRQAQKAALYADVISDIEISEQEIMGYYFANVDSFRYDEVRDIYTIYYGTKSDAAAAIEEIKEGDFISFYNNVDISEEGVIGPQEKAIYKTHFPKVTAGEFDEEIADIIFGLQDKTYYLEPILCNVGYFLVFVDGIYKDYTFSYDEMLPYIKEALIDERADDVAKQFFADLNERYNVQILEQ